MQDGQTNPVGSVTREMWAGLGRIDVDRGLYSTPRRPAVLHLHLPRWRATTRIFLTMRFITSRLHHPQGAAQGDAFARCAQRYAIGIPNSAKAPAGVLIYGIARGGEMVYVACPPGSSPFFWLATPTGTDTFFRIPPLLLCAARSFDGEHTYTVPGFQPPAPAWHSHAHRATDITSLRLRYL
ncbi:hypothetical protein K438DRAFT_1970448 [Mycena galopus ATCC 62051]|nr:hypothetical protein K438DRAFT_1970448 [Mycena galopus ATCC 62051]